MEVSQDDLLAAWMRRAFRTVPKNPTFMRAWKADLKEYLEFHGLKVLKKEVESPEGKIRIAFDFWAEPSEFVIEMNQEIAEKVMVLGFP